MFYEIKKTSKTPYLCVDTKSGKFSLSGRCIIEFPREFFKEFLNHIDIYSKDPNEKTTFDISLEYSNTGSTKCIFDILKKIDTIPNISINWIYEYQDEDIMELGKDFEDLLSSKFNFIEVK